MGRRRQERRRQEKIKGRQERPKPAAAGWLGERLPYLGVAGIILVAAFTLIIYGQTLWVPAIDYEDSYYLIRNPYVNVPDASSRLGAVWTEPYFANFHPVTSTTWLLDRALADKRQPFDSRPFRAMHLVYAVLGAALLIPLYRCLGLPPLFAVLGALLYAVHPIHTEVVAWLSARKDLVSLIFIVLSFLSYLWARASATRTRWMAGHLGTAVLALLAVLAKPIAVIVPVLFAAYELCAERPAPGAAMEAALPFAVPAGIRRHISPVVTRTLALAAIFLVVGGVSTAIFRSLLSRDPLHGAWLIAVPLGLCALLLAGPPQPADMAEFAAGRKAGLRVIGPPFVVYSVVFGAGSAWTFWAQSAAGAIKGGLPLLPTLNLTADAMLLYAGKTVVPAFMSTAYVWNEFPAVSVRGALGALLVLALAGGALRLSAARDRNLRLAAFGIFWYLVAFIPVSNLVPTSTKMADRYLFVPSLGAILAALALVAFFCARSGPAGRDASSEKAKQVTTLAVLALVFVGYAGWAYERTEVWCGKTTLWKGKPHPDLSLWTRAVETHPDNASALTSLALVYLRFQPPEPEQALPLLQRALQLNEAQQAAIPGGKRLDISPVLRALGDAWLALAHGSLAKPETPEAREKNKEALRKAVDYLGEASVIPWGFAPSDARMLRSLASAREELARIYDQEMAAAPSGARESLARQRDQLRREAEQAIEHARSVLIDGNVSRADPDFRGVMLEAGTMVFGREATTPPPERPALFRKALAIYEEAQALFPDDPRPVFYAGLCYERLYRLEPATEEKRKLFASSEAAFRKALTRSGSAPEYQPLLPYRALAALYGAAGDYRAALESLRKVQQADPAYSRTAGVDAEIASLERYLGVSQPR